MDGNEAYEALYNKKIDTVLSQNKDKTYLKGFCNYISYLSITTVYDYVNLIAKFMNETGKKASELTLDDYTECISRVSSYTSSYQITTYAALKKFSLYLFASRQNKDNPMEFVQRPKAKESIKTKKKRENGYLTAEEISLYLKRVNEGLENGYSVNDWRRLRDKAMILLFLNTGLRMSAVFKLNVDSIDFDNKTLITVDKGEKYQEYELSDDLLKVLSDWIYFRDFAVEDDDENALFISNNSKRLDRRSIAYIVEKYSIDINGKKITPHKLRATYGTELYRQTKDLYFVQECMGHSSPKTTELYIRGESKSSRKKASAIMSNITMKK